MKTRPSNRPPPKTAAERAKAYRERRAALIDDLTLAATRGDKTPFVESLRPRRYELLAADVPETVYAGGKNSARWYASIARENRVLRRAVKNLDIDNRLLRRYVRLLELELNDLDESKLIKFVT